MCVCIFINRAPHPLRQPCRRAVPPPPIPTRHRALPHLRIHPAGKSLFQQIPYLISTKYYAFALTYFAFVRYHSLTHSLTNYSPPRVPTRELLLDRVRHYLLISAFFYSSSGQLTPEYEAMKQEMLVMFREELERARVEILESLRR